VNIRVSIIIVNYNSSKELFNCIKSIKRYSLDFTYEIIIVDNNSIDNFDFVKNYFKDVKYYRMTFNTGFAYACNYGIKQSHGEFILLLNPDTMIKDNAILKLINFFKLLPNIGAVGPIFLNKHNKEYLPYSIFPNLLRQICEVFYLKSILKIISRTKIQKERLEQKKYFEVDWLAGACIMIKKRLLDAVQGLDEEYHLYYEDVDLCHKIIKNGFKVYCEPNITIYHFGSRSIKNNYFQLIFQRYRSKLIYAKSYFPKMNILLFRMIIIFGLIIRIALTPLRYNISLNEKRTRISGYKSSLLLYLGLISLENKFYDKI